jgi:hypothetical protein
MVFLSFVLAVAGCGGDITESDSPTPNASTTPADLSEIACATADPADICELTGAWAGNDHGVYYIRQVGDCVWWFGTELQDIQPGATRQPGFANVASGRVDGSEIKLEWADVPMGNILNGGGLALTFDRQNDQLVITERRGDGEPFVATMFSRIEPHPAGRREPE